MKKIQDFSIEKMSCYQTLVAESIKSVQTAVEKKIYEEKELTELAYMSFWDRRAKVRERILDLIDEGIERCWQQKKDGQGRYDGTQGNVRLDVHMLGQAKHLATAVIAKNQQGNFYELDLGPLCDDYLYRLAIPDGILFQEYLDEFKYSTLKSGFILVKIIGSSFCSNIHVTFTWDLFSSQPERKISPGPFQQKLQQKIDQEISGIKSILEDNTWQEIVEKCLLGLSGSEIEIKTDILVSLPEIVAKQFNSQNYTIDNVKFLLKPKKAFDGLGLYLDLVADISGLF